MIIDYKNDREFALANGVKQENGIGQIHFTGKKLVRDIIFRNFDNLWLEGSIFVDCKFENCGSVTASRCQMNECCFTNVVDVTGVRTDFTDCEFQDCTAEDSFLIIDSKGQVDGCTFQNVTAVGHIIYSVYGKKNEIEVVKNCKFIDCRAESGRGKLCYCAYFKPFSSFNTVKVDNVDYDSCVFIDGAAD